MSKKNAIIIGAGQGLGRALALKLAPDYNLIVSSRTTEHLNNLIEDLKKISSNEIHSIEINLSQSNDEYLDVYVNRCIDTFNNIDLIFITAGENLDNDDIENFKTNFTYLTNINYKSIAKLITSFVDHMKHQEYGKLFICTSIAIFAPRSQNIVYGSSKIALDYFCQSVQNYLLNTNIKLTILRIGYLKTAKTKKLKTSFPILSPEKASEIIIRNIQSKKLDIFIPAYWKFIIALLKCTPKFIYNNFFSTANERRY